MNKILRSLKSSLQYATGFGSIRVSGISLLFTTHSRNMSGNHSNFILRQLFEHKSFTYTYILGDKSTNQAIIIDPVIEMVDRDLGIIKDLGLELVYAVNTHVHADHITGSGKMKQRQSTVRSVLSSESGAQADLYLKHREKLKVGDLELESRATPGHTNGCMSLVAHGQGMVFTGDAVLIRGCGRTDFQQGDSRKLHQSVHSQIFSLPDDYIVYPAHDYTGQTLSSVREEKNLNKRLTKTEDEFVKIMENLNLPYPKQIDVALPANLVCGIFDEPEERKPKT